MRYAIVTILAVLTVGCGNGGTPARPYMGPPLQLSFPKFESAPPMHTYNFPRGSVTCQTIGSQTFCN